MDELIAALREALEKCDAHRKILLSMTVGLVNAIKNTGGTLHGDGQVFHDAMSAQEECQAAAPGIVRELLVEIERLQSGFDWLSGQEVSISDFTAPCQCKNEYLQNEECSKGINPDDVCPYYNHRGTGECWVDYIKNIATAKEKS